MHKACKYSFKSTIKKTKVTYSGLQNRDVDIIYTEDCTRCGLNPGSIVIMKGQPLCSNFEARRKPKC